MLLRLSSDPRFAPKPRRGPYAPVSSAQVLIPCEPLIPACFLLKIKSMSMDEDKEARFHSELRAMEIISGLQHALDQHYRRLCEVARADWERLFGDKKDPADACVTVRVAAVETTAIRGSGFLKSRRPIESKSSTKSLPRFAH